MSHDWQAAAAMFFAAFLLLPPAYAQSKAAQYLIDEQMNAACDGPGGQLRPGVGAIERDLTGDGKPDLIINHRGIQCPTGMSGFCGARTCDLLIYVRRGNLLKLEFDTMADANPSVTKGKIPNIVFPQGDGGSHKIRWNGKRFE